MKIGIVTFHRAYNYGAILQAYALQRFLSEQGFDAVLVDYESDYLKHPFGKANWQTKGILAQCFTLVGELSRLPRRKPFHKFRNSIPCTLPVKKEDLPRLEKDFDLFISGSDQVWNHKISNRDGAYFLDFVSDFHKKGSYAASFGFSQVTHELEQWYRPYFKDFKYLLVREKSCLPLIEKLTGRQADVVIDPTLLLTKKAWENLLKRPGKTEPYILTYQVGMDPKLLDYAKYLASKTGYKLYSIPFPQGGLLNSRWIVNASPEQWLGWIFDAAYVVTDSFHGTALSIALETEFFVCHSSGTAMLSSRIDDLLIELDIKDHYVKETPCALPPPINYQTVASHLEKVRNRSIEAILRMCRGS